MNKKAFILASFFVIGLYAWQAQAATHESAPIIYDLNNLPNGYDEIILQGELLLSIGPNAIEAGASDDAVYIGFNQSFGNVNISIYNSIGNLVYSTVVNTDVQQVFIIPFSGIASGTYTVELNNADGYADGDFEHN